MHQHRPQQGAALRINRLERVFVALLMGAVLHAEDQVPPVVVPPVVVPPVVVPPAIDAPMQLEQLIIPEAFLRGQGVFEDEDDVGDVVEPPAIATPHAPAKPGAMILRWDSYRTLVVIDSSAGRLKPCWIVTFATMPEQIPTPRGLITLAPGQVVVAYRGQAYYDKDGILHIDARRARLSGTVASNWSPDSFAINPTKELSARDDDPTHPSNSGEVEKEVSAETQPQEYRRLLFTAQTLVEGTI